MKIAFFHNNMRSFVKLDLEMLQSQHEVRVIEFKPDNYYISKIFDAVKWCDVVFGWWATWHMVLPAYLASKQHKKVVVVGGDYDIYFTSKYKSLTRKLMDQARRILGYYLFPKISQYIVNSDFSLSLARKLPYINSKQITRIYHGFRDPLPTSFMDKNNIALSVGTVSRYELSRKGLYTFVDSAQYIPETQFILIGPWKDNSINILQKLNSQNVSYSGFVSDKELAKAMAEAKVYVQVSSHEGFGMALAEAMLFQCAPVVTERGSIPEVVGDCGLYVPYGNSKETAKAIRQAGHNHVDIGAKARERILTLYPFENREKRLLDIICN